MPRLFVAIDLPARARAALSALVDPALAARWVAPAQLHITVRFLGSVAAAEATRLPATLAEVEAPPAFAVALAGVGIFPAARSRQPPAVLWAGIAGAAQVPLRALKTAVDAALGPDPEGDGRGYTPHVTLARFKHPPPGPALTAFLTRHADRGSPGFPVDAFCLYESRTLADGPVYHALARYPLG